ncbi:MAG: restriction endonuclease [Deltaproteobacteria bacterium]|nr:restriction endonuclease [Deltaproteobacteria bacterium]
MPFFPSTPPFNWSANEDGLAIRFSDSKCYVKAKKGRAPEADQLAFIRMQMLLECGQAEIKDVDCGVFILSSDAARLDMDIRESFFLPSPWPGGLRLQTTSVPQLQGFHAQLGLVNPGATVFWDWRLRGPILEVGDSYYLPTAAQYAALKAYQEWMYASTKDEFTNLSLLATLREAREEGLRIDLEAYRETIIAHADEMSVDVREEIGTGDLILRPVVSGSFPDLGPDDIEERIAQLQLGTDRTILRVGKTIVLLNPLQTKQARAVAARRRVPRKERKTFETNPSVWLTENVFPDIETEFSPRVTGIGIWPGGYLGADWEAGQDWFGRKPSAQKITGSAMPGTLEKPDEPDDSSQPDTKPIVPLIIPNDAELGFGWQFPEPCKDNIELFEPNFTRYGITPYQHQEEAVRWLLGHARRALERQKTANSSEGYGAGALLADDMGLGKTFSTLIFIAEWFDLWRKTTETEPPAILIVAPLSLMENWKQEIEKCFRSDHRVFTRVLIAQADAELSKVRRSPDSRDIATPGQVLQYGLGFGDATERSIDYPGGCVLTTYQTLRDYRFSFAKAEWSAAVFDEAQNIKNPNALQTIAAKALKALFRLTLTGTPVENHLGDFWSIIDTSEPGPLGSFAEFKRNWIQRMIRDRDHMAEIGKELRDLVGGLMLRRIKEDELKGLPKKTGGSEPIFVDMSSEQAALYKTVIAAAHNAGNTKDPDGKARLNQQIAALWQLRQVSLHPDLLGGGNIRTANSQASSRAALCRSGKLAWLLNQLDEIKEIGEKVLIFCVQKKLQEALAHHLGQIYTLTVPVINGDTKATSNRKPETTRLGLIAQFGSQSGFAICVLSPIAAGAGLNIVAANHVIHLERHWNPAKEDQATDRVYRIGQTRPVTVYLPTCTNPDIASFDLVLHRLIDGKRNLQSALGLIPPEAVSAPELLNEVFGYPDEHPEHIEYIDLRTALQLSWSLFEALIATIYKKNAKRVILTTGSADHGCDVVVFDYGAERENLLIQCKFTSRDELDSELAIREIEGARPFYESATGIIFNRRCLHTTAKKFSRRTRQAAELCDVTIHGRSWLTDILGSTKIEKTAVLATDTQRERI